MKHHLHPALVAALAAALVVGLAIPCAATPRNPWHVNDGLTVFVLDITAPGFQDTGVDLALGHLYTIIVTGAGSTSWDGANPDSYPYASFVDAGGLSSGALQGRACRFPRRHPSVSWVDSTRAGRVHSTSAPAG